MRASESMVTILLVVNFEGSQIVSKYLIGEIGLGDTIHITFSDCDVVVAMA